MIKLTEIELGAGTLWKNPGFPTIKFSEEISYLTSTNNPPETPYIIVEICKLRRISETDLRATDIPQ